jgi:hypothetical protein
VAAQLARDHVVEWHLARRPRGLRRLHPAVRGRLLLDTHDVVLPVDVAPLQPERLPDPQARARQHRYKQPVLWIGGGEQRREAEAMAGVFGV